MNPQTGIKLSSLDAAYAMAAETAKNEHQSYQEKLRKYLRSNTQLPTEIIKLMLENDTYTNSKYARSAAQVLNTLWPYLSKYGIVKASLEAITERINGDIHNGAELARNTVQNSVGELVKACLVIKSRDHVYALSPEAFKPEAMVLTLHSQEELRVIHQPRTGQRIAWLSSYNFKLSQDQDNAT